MKQNNFITKYQIYITSILICLGLGMISGYLSNSGASDWYNHLIKPDFTPPAWIFAPVWTILYIIMGIVLAKLWQDREHTKTLLWLFCIQFIFNLLWSPLFFYLHRVDLALYDIILLWLSILIFMILSFKTRMIFILFLPYIAWTSIALILNLYIHMMNLIVIYNF